MNRKYKELLLYLIGIASGIVIGYLIFIPIFEDTFMGLYMGFLIGVGIWFSIRKTNMNFKGGTDIWSAELHAVNNQEKQFILKYKGDSINTGNIEFKLNAPNWAWGMGGIKLDNEGIYVTEDINVDKISTSESDIIEVEIKWNDKVDTFTLKNE